MHFNDGYLETLNSAISFRRLLSPERGMITNLIRSKRVDKAEEFLFKPPFVFSDDPLTESEKQELFVQLMDNPTEQEDVDNLIYGTRLFATNPRLATRSCELCKRWLFDEDTGLVAKSGGKYLARRKNTPTLCDSGSQEKCPKGHHSDPREMSPKNNQALNHYLEWEGTGVCPHPECPIMRRNWMWIKRIFDKYGHPAVHGGVRKSAD